MMKSKILIALLFSGMHLSLTAGEVDIPNTFSAGTPAVAAEVNGNFTAVETAVDGNAVDIAAVLATLTALEATVTAMDARLATLETENLALEADVASLQTDNTALLADNALLQNFITEVVPYLQGASDAQGNPAVFFSGVNLHVNNGGGFTFAVNGTGNLIVGYDESLSAESDFCTVIDSGGSAYTAQTDCEDNNGVWGTDSQKIGSHNLIIGRGNNYTQYGGLIAGIQNTVTAPYSSVSGGEENFAEGYASSVSGGRGNEATGFASSVSGGRFGGASGSTSSISGGSLGSASGNSSSVNGGIANSAVGDSSSVSGGNSRTATGDSDWVAGSLFEGN